MAPMLEYLFFILADVSLKNWSSVHSVAEISLFVNYLIVMRIIELKSKSEVALRLKANLRNPLVICWSIWTMKALWSILAYLFSRGYSYDGQR